MKKNKGITMISLVITIIVLLIVTSITIGNGLGQLGIKRVNNLYADIESISTKVAEYYLKNGTLPVYDNLYVNNKQELEELFKKNGATENITNVNDGDEYYVINPTKLDNLTLNYGDDYKEWTNTSTSEEIQNIYIINSVTHQIYFPHGVRSGDEYFFARFPDENEITAVELGEIEGELEVILTSISGNNIGNDKISVVADVELKTDETKNISLNNFNLDTLEFAWSDKNDNTYNEKLSYTKFSINSVNQYLANATLSKNSLSRNQEYIYLVIRVMDKNGEKKYFISEQINVPIVLPDEYQRVEYLETTGTQYIDTVYKPKTNTELKLEVSFEGEFYPKSGGGGNIFSARSDEAEALFNLNFGASSSQSNLLFVWFKKGATVQNFNITDDIKRNKNLIIMKGGNISYGSVSKKLTAKDRDNEESLILFGYRKGVDEVVSFESYRAKVYSLQLSDDELKRNFIPCYRKSDNVKGLYDIVEGKFYTNQGTGDDFIAGENVY